MERAKILTELYIKSIRNPQLPASFLGALQECLIQAQRLLTPSQFVRYEKWHLKKWPNLDW